MRVIAMSTVTDVTTAPLSGYLHIDALLDSLPGWNYLLPTQHNILYYSFSLQSGTEPGVTGQSAFNAAQIGATQAALATVTTLTGIRFVQTPNGLAANIHFANQNIANPQIAGLCSSRYNYNFIGVDTLQSYSAQSYVYLDNQEFAAANLAPTMGTQGYETLLHEIGHAVGLNHPFDGAITLPTSLNNTGNTLMSYTSSGGTPHSTFQPYDVAALNWLYGGDGLGGMLGIGPGTSGKYLTGTGENDNLFTAKGNDKLEGLAGNDILNGGAYSDTMIGGLGNDIYIVSTGDVITENAGAGTDLIRSAVTWTLGANLENLILTGTAASNGIGNGLANRLTGNAVTNTLTGEAGNDVLHGRAGDDRLVGGLGKDTLTGGLGSDRFDFNSAAATGPTNSTRDVITDFKTSEGDNIDLSTMDADTTIAGNQAFASMVGGFFSGTFANPGEFYFDQTAHILYGNNDADSQADFTIQINGVDSLDASAFML